MSERIRISTPVLVAIAAMGIAVITWAAWPTKAKAADKGGANVLEDIAPKPGGAWSGCGPTLRGGWVTAGIDNSPATISSEGLKAGVGLSCDYQVGKHFLIGAFVSYDWVSNDLNTIGVNNDLTIGARVGVPLNR